MTPFIFNTTPSIHFGAGQAAHLSDILHQRALTRVLIVTDPGMIATGLVDDLLAPLATGPLKVAVFDQVLSDPPEHVVIQAVNTAKNHRAEAIIGFGGGSSLDVAKLVALLADSDEKLADIYGVGLARGPRLPLIQIPTTSGTGSEVTPVAIVTTGTSEKMGVVSPLLLPDVALLDAALTLGLPAPITAATGIDAMVHAIEAYASLNPNNNPLSRSLAREALRLMGRSLETAVHSPADIAARSDMLLGSMFAGQAFANSPVAAVHALAYPIGGHFKVPHGLSNALVLPHVLRFNAETAPTPYAQIAAIAFPALAGNEGREAATGFADALADLAHRCGLQPRLRDVNIPRDALAMLARDAMHQTRLLVNNPRPITEADALAIYTAAW